MTVFNSFNELYSQNSDVPALVTSFATDNATLPPGGGGYVPQQPYIPKINTVSDPAKGAQASGAVAPTGAAPAQQADKTAGQQKSQEQPKTLDQRVLDLETDVKDLKTAVFHKKTGLAALGENMNKILQWQEKFDQKHPS